MPPIAARQASSVFVCGARIRFSVLISARCVYPRGLNVRPLQVDVFQLRQLLQMLEARVGHRAESQLDRSQVRMTGEQFQPFVGHAATLGRERPRRSAAPARASVARHCQCRGSAPRRHMTAGIFRQQCTGRLQRLHVVRPFPPARRLTGRCCPPRSWPADSSAPTRGSRPAAARPQRQPANTENSQLLDMATCSTVSATGNFSNYETPNGDSLSPLRPCFGKPPVPSAATTGPALPAAVKFNQRSLATLTPLSQESRSWPPFSNPKPPASPAPHSSDPVLHRRPVGARRQRQDVRDDQPGHRRSDRPGGRRGRGRRRPGRQGRPQGVRAAAPGARWTPATAAG